MNDHCWTELDTDVLEGNLRAAQRALQPDTALFFVVKSDAYGHGMASVVRCAVAAGIDCFAVAHVEEGIALRALQPRATIMVLCAPPPDTVPDLLDKRLIPVIAGPEHGEAMADAVCRCRPGSLLRCHVKIDTGMSRLGFDWTRAPRQLQVLSRHNGLRIEGIASHFAAAGGEAPARTARQFQRFSKVISACLQDGMALAMSHISASGGFCENSQWDLDAVRLGILLYGYPPMPSACRIAVRPALQWKTRVLQVKPLPRGRSVGYGATYTVRGRRRIALLSVGYGDGYSRHLSNRGVVLIDGCRCPVVGRVSMNLTAVSLPPNCRAQAGDIAVLIGCQGGAAVWADELAAAGGTIPYEVLTSIRCS